MAPGMKRQSAEAPESQGVQKKSKSSKPVKRVRFDTNEEVIEQPDFSSLPSFRAIRRNYKPCPAIKAELAMKEETSETDFSFSSNFRTLRHESESNPAVKEEGQSSTSGIDSSILFMASSTQEAPDSATALRYAGFREPEPLTYTQQDEEESKANCFLRDVCCAPMFKARFGVIRNIATLLPSIEQTLAHIDEIYDFLREEKERLLNSLEHEARVEVRNNREKLRKQVVRKMRKLKTTRAEFISAKELVEAGKLGDLPHWSWEDREERSKNALTTVREFGEFPQEGTMYFMVDGSHQEPL